MRRQSSVASILFAHLFPKPGSSDPPNFQTHLARDLIPEIRIETATFYGSLDSIEARYPGLNYCHGPHRMRLGRFPHHARLFKAIDDLKITDQEVMDLVRWEGTLWARQRFERDEGVKVRDTTGDGITEWIDSRTVAAGHSNRIKVETQIEVTEGMDPMIDGPVEPTEDAMAPADVASDNDDDEDMDGHVHANVQVDDDMGDTIQSIGNDLNRRIIAAIAARQQGLDVEMDPEFEDYMKRLFESGRLQSTARPADGPLLGQPSTTSNPIVRQPAA
ncbi:hypothetical protein MBLNU459_g3759t1 [Dothideomycetes sp. NU459]